MENPPPPPVIQSRLTEAEVALYVKRKKIAEDIYTREGIYVKQLDDILVVRLLGHCINYLLRTI